MFRFEVFRFAASIAAALVLAGDAVCAVVDGTFTAHDPTRPDREITAVWFCDDQSAADVDLIVFGHATMTPVSQYHDLARALAADGYLVLLPTGENHFLGDQDALARDMVVLAEDALDAGLPAWPPRTGRWALGGHSLGGGAAVLAAGRRAPDALLLLAPQERSRPSMIEVAGGLDVPTLIVSGTLDCVTPPGLHHHALYHSLAAVPRALVNLVGGGHCGFAEPCEPCRGVESGCPPLLDHDTMQSLALSLAVPWLGWHLRDHDGSRWAFMDAVDHPQVAAELELGATATPLVAGSWRLRALSASPSGASSRWRLEGTTASRRFKAGIYDLRGRHVASPVAQAAGQAVELGWNGRDQYGVRVPAGVYVLRVESTDFVLTRRVVRLP